MNYKLRDYQQHAIDEIERNFTAGTGRQILAMPTGAGKTITAACMIHQRAQEGKRCLFIVDRKELVRQAAKTLEGLGLQVGILQGDNTDMRPDDEVTVASVQTIRSRGFLSAEFIIVDEVHILHKAHIDLLKHNFHIPTVGLSATPLRRDLGQYFEQLVRGPTVRQLMEEGSLVKQIHAYCPGADAMWRILDEVKTRAGDFIDRDLSKALNRKELVGDLITTWQEKAGDRQTLCFAVDIAHSKSIIEDFCAAGIHAEHLDAFTPAEERDRIITAFRNHDLQILSSVNVLGIGFDVPAASCAILARPTLSEMLHMQQIGRVLRPADGKDDCVVLDHAGNTIRFGLPQHFTVPDLDDQDTTSTKERRKQVKAVVCKECGYVLEPGQLTCPACGLDRVTRQSKVHYIDGKLVEYGSEDELQEYSHQQRLEWYLAFLWHARHTTKKDGTPFKDNWAAHAWKEKFRSESFPPWKWKDLTPVMPNDEQQRWIRYYQIRQAKSWAKLSKKSPVPKRKCPACNSTATKVVPGKGPHAAGMRCADCGKHLGWLAKDRRTA